MPPKLQLDKAAWQWVTDVVDPQEVTKSHVDIAYRCNLKPCPKGECKYVRFSHFKSVFDFINIGFGDLSFKC